MAHIQYIYLTNFKYFLGPRKFGPFSTQMTAVYGNTGVGKSIMIEAVSFVFGEKPTNLGAANFKELINEHANSCTITLVITVQHNLTKRFTKAILQEEDEEGNMLPHGTQFYIDDEMVEEDEFNIELTSARILHEGMCHVVHNSRNQIRYDIPECFGDYFQRVFGLDNYRDDYERLKKQIKAAEKKMTQLKTIDEALVLEKETLILYTLGRLLSAQNMMRENRRHIAAREREIKDLQDMMLQTARNNYFKSKAMTMANYKKEKQRLEQAVSDLKARDHRHRGVFDKIYAECTTNNIVLPKNTIPDNDPTKHRFTINFSVLPKERVNTGRKLFDYVQEVGAELSKIRRDWPVINKLEAHTYVYEAYADRQKAHDEKMAAAKEELERLTKKYDEVKNEYTGIFRNRMAFFEDSLSDMHKEVYNDQTRKITFELEDEEDVNAGITIVSHTKSTLDQPIIQLSGGEKKLIELAVIFTVARLTDTPFVFIDNLDNHFHWKTFPHLLNFLEQKSGHLCQVIVVCRNSGLHRHIPERIQILDADTEQFST